jgi:hypothetical protein
MFEFHALVGCLLILSVVNMVQVALKAMVVIHRTLREGDPTFREELINYSRNRGHILNLSNFKDDSSPNGVHVFLYIFFCCAIWAFGIWRINVCHIVGLSFWGYNRPFDMQGKGSLVKLTFCYNWVLARIWPKLASGIIWVLLVHSLGLLSMGTYLCTVLGRATRMLSGVEIWCGVRACSSKDSIFTTTDNLCPWRLWKELCSSFFFWFCCCFLSPLGFLSSLPYLMIHFQIWDHHNLIIGLSLNAIQFELNLKVRRSSQS